jgi:hypothetical protein
MFLLLLMAQISESMSPPLSALAGTATSSRGLVFNTNIATGWIVCVNGPFPCGRYTDLKIAKSALHHILDHGERYIADGGYVTHQALNPHDAFSHEERMYMQICRTRHETINRLLKNFAIVGTVFKREVGKHGLFLYSVANVVQVGIMFGEIRPFSVSEFMDEPASWPESW